MIYFIYLFACWVNYEAIVIAYGLFPKKTTTNNAFTNIQNVKWLRSRSVRSGSKPFATVSISRQMSLLAWEEFNIFIIHNYNDHISCYDNVLHCFGLAIDCPMHKCIYKLADNI